ncbi:unnamed protein product [Parajaminaea phylloscopi]
MNAVSSTLTSLTGLSNVSLLVIPLCWINSILPHFYAASLTGGRFTNASPRSYTASIQKKERKTPTDEKYLRAEAASMNGFENLALAAAAFTLGNYAKLPVKELNTLSAAYLLSRVLYNLSYIFITSEALATFRSIIFLSGIGIIFKLFISSAYALN